METEHLFAQAFLTAHPEEAAARLERLTSSDAATLPEDTPPQVAALILPHMSPFGAVACLTNLATERAGPILAALPLASAAVLLRRVEPSAQERLLTTVSATASAPLKRLLHYPEGSAGALMDPQALALPEDMVVNEALERVRQTPQHVLYYLYVVNRTQVLVGVLNLRELMLASPTAPVQRVMRLHVARIAARGPRRPLICFAERPCFLIAERGAILPLSPGKVKRYHYGYKKHGACCGLLACEPHTGVRSVEVRERRAAVDYADFMQTLLARHYPKAASIRLVQDNLNTHTPGSFSAVLPPREAVALAQCCEAHYTPKKGSWLTMAEIECAALSKQCLDRRLPEVEPLRRAVRAWAERRNQEGKTVHWKFSQDKARETLHRHYSNVQKFS